MGNDLNWRLVLQVERLFLSQRVSLASFANHYIIKWLATEEPLAATDEGGIQLCVSGLCLKEDTMRPIGQLARGAIADKWLNRITSDRIKSNQIKSNLY